MRELLLLKTIYSKALKNPAMTKDCFNYIKYLAIKNCPGDKLFELKDIFSKNDIHGFLTLLSRYIPNIGKELSVYIENY